MRDVVGLPFCSSEIIPVSSSNGTNRQKDSEFMCQNGVPALGWNKVDIPTCFFQFSEKHSSKYLENLILFVQMCCVETR